MLPLSSVGTMRVWEHMLKPIALSKIDIECTTSLFDDALVSLALEGNLMAVVKKRWEKLLKQESDYGNSC